MIETIGAGWVRFIFDHVVESPVHLVGDFNGWNEISHSMERLENGTHQIIIKLAPGEYEFKYKSGCVWFNDSAAHKYVPNCWGSENSVVVVPEFDAIEAEDGSMEDEPPGEDPSPPDSAERPRMYPGGP